MVKQQKNLSSSPASPHWRRLDQGRHQADHLKDKDALSKSALRSRLSSPSGTEESRLPAPANIKPLSSTKSLPQSAAVISDQQRWWHGIPLVSWWINWQLKIARKILSFFTADGNPSTKPFQPGQISSLPPSSQAPSPPSIFNILWQWIWQVFFWGSGLFIIVIPIRWALGYYRRTQQAIAGGISATLDPQKKSIIPLWLKEILLIALAAVLLPIYLRDKIFFGVLRGTWWLLRKATLLAAIFWLYFPLAVFIVSAILGNSWLIPSQYPNIGLWIDAMEYY